MTKEDLKVGHVYSAKKPQVTGLFTSFWNDRQIRWIGESTVQYDSPTLKQGYKYPRIKIAAFLRWAKEDVTKDTPKGDWREAT